MNTIFKAFLRNNFFINRTQLFLHVYKIKKFSSSDAHSGKPLYFIEPFPCTHLTCLGKPGYCPICDYRSHNHKDVTDDIHGAQNAGIRGFLVQTGKYKEGDQYKISPEPNAVFPSIVEAIDFILDELNDSGSSHFSL